MDSLPKNFNLLTIYIPSRGSEFIFPFAHKRILETGNHEWQQFWINKCHESQRLSVSKICLNYFCAQETKETQATLCQVKGELIIKAFSVLGWIVSLKWILVIMVKYFWLANRKLWKQRLYKQKHFSQRMPENMTLQ